MTKQKDLRLGALRRFAFGITALNLSGHFFLGFEQSWAQYFVAMGSACVLELTFEFVDAIANQRPVLVGGGIMRTVDYFLPAIITGNAIAMLLFANDRLAPICLAVAIGMGTKRLFRVRINGIPRHFLNPSNTGIAVVLLLFSSVGVAPPYQFTHYLAGVGDILLPALLLIPATLITVVFTKRWPLVLSWLGVFVVQALVRSVAFGFPPVVALVPMTGVVFVLFTFYMLPDPGTTPISVRGQVAFGATVALVYGILQVAHVVFGLFFALAITCVLRGFWLWARPSTGPLKDIGAAPAMEIRVRPADPVASVSEP